MAAFNFANAVLEWHGRNGRHDLPWQQPRTPYRVWVSEIMLQQTQVATVLNYYENFLRSFPTLKDLALAPSEQVMRHWAGLGYYSRARNLHKSAQICLAEFNAELPVEYSQLVQLPGIGRSTAGAILSQAHGEAFAILDGNVKRLLSRFYAIGGDVNSSQTLKKLWQYAEALLPADNLADYTQAMMDLGALVCSRRSPCCSACPLMRHCQAFQNNCVEMFPNKSLPKAVPKRELYALIILNENNEILLEKRPNKGIWGGLYSLPEAGDISQAKNLAAQFINRPEAERQLTAFTHQFSHFQLSIKPIIWQNCNPKHQIRDNNQFHWVAIHQLAQLGLPAPIKKLLQGLT